MPNDPQPPITIGHTVVHTDDQGVVHVQKLGREHEVEGSATIITLPPGARVIIRHVAS